MNDDTNIVTPRREERKSGKHIWLIIFLLILILLMAVLIYFMQKQNFVKSKSYWYTEDNLAEPKGSVEISNSYAFASPLRAKANGEYIRVTVYVLDAQGLGIRGKSVEIGEVSGLEVKEGMPTSDDTGMIYFDVSATKGGLYVIQPVVEGKSLNQRIDIIFE